MTDDDEQPATLDEVLGRLKLVTYNLSTLRRYTAVIVIATVAQAAFMALWIFGIITVEFKPVAR